MPPKQQKAASSSALPKDSIVPLLKTPQFYWFLGHVLVLISVVISTIQSFFSKKIFWYKTGLAAVLFTYAVVLRQSHFKSKAGVSNQALSKLVRDENLHYFGLAAVFYLSAGTIGQVSGGLYSFAVFSLFHFLSYFQNNILNVLPISLGQQQQISTRISNFTSKFNEAALMIAASSELMLLTGFVFSVPMTVINIFRAPFYAIVNLFVFAYIVVFLKLRWNSNRYTQYVVELYNTRINQFFASPLGQNIPPGIKEGYFRLQAQIITFLAPIHFPKVLSKKQ